MTALMRMDAKRFLDACRGALRRAPGARVRSAIEGGRIFARELVRLSPRDTNRYVRGWALAGNQAGVGPLFVPAVVASGHAARYLDQLERQVAYWQRRVDEAQGQVNFWLGSARRRPLVGGQVTALRNAEKQLRSAQSRLRRAEEHLERFVESQGEAIVIGAFANVGVRRVVQIEADGTRRVRYERRRGLATTVRHKVYGGRGRLIDGPKGTIVQLHNLEPHATIVESRRKVVATATRTVRRMGMQRISRAYVDSIAGPNGPFRVVKGDPVVRG